jgi:thimet oligopeptidase
VARAIGLEQLFDDPVAAAAGAGDLSAMCDQALARAQQLATELRALAAAPEEEVTWEAVLGRLDEVQYLLRFTRTFPQLLADIHPDGDVRDAARACAARSDQVETDLLLDPELAAAIKRLAVRTSDGELDIASARLLAHTLRELRRNGLDLPAAGQAELRRLNEEITRLGQEFYRNLAEAEGRVEVPPSALEGLPAEYVAAHLGRALPNGNVVITTDYPDLFPFIRYAKDRAAARALYAAFDRRAADANVPVLEQLLAARERKARLLGYACWADYAIEPRMAGTAAAVWELLRQVGAAVEKPADAEMAEFREVWERLGGRRDAPLYPPDRYYLEEQLRETKHGYDSRELARYFEVTRVQAGVLDVAAQLYGLEFRRAAEAPRWHPDVEVYDVLSAGEPAGRLYMDLYPRSGKFKHAGAFEIRSVRPARGPRGRVLPVAALVCNFPRPGGAQPALLGHDQVVIFFHEMGHVLHQLLSEAPFAVFAGEAVTRDFQEVPSQVFEEWAFRREVLDLFARHHQTGARIPEPLFEALTRSRRVGLALATEVQLFVSALDLEYHSRPAGFDTTKVMRELFAKYQRFTYIEATQYQATFAHLIGYDAGYYGYQWALWLARDVLDRFGADGFLNPDAAARWRTTVLARGGSEDEALQIERFLGRKPTPRAYLEYLQQR